jgi:hypothetical protein
MREPLVKKSPGRAARVLRPLAWAVLTMTVVVGVLLALRPGEGNSAAPSWTSPTGQGPLPPASPREGLPAQAWAILDIELSRFPALAARVPGALETLDCRQVAPPKRMSIALMEPSRTAPQQRLPEFLVAASETTPGFRQCARQRMQQAEEVPSRKWPGNIEVLQRDGGLRLLLQEDRDLLVFVSAPSVETERLIEIFNGTGPRASEHGQHAALLRSLPPSEGLALTVTLPDRWMEADHWLEDVVEPAEAQRSPLRFLRATAWSLGQNGLQGIVDCKATEDGHGCASLARFMERSRTDLLEVLASREQHLPEDDWKLTQTGPTRLEILWSLPMSTREHLLQLLTRQF